MSYRYLWPLALAPLFFGTDIACGTSKDVGNLSPTPPTLTSVAPAQISARGGDVLVLQGTEFSAETTVQFGDANAAKVELVSATQLKVTAPPLFAGATNVTIAEPSGKAELDGVVQVMALDLRFVQAPTYSLTIVNDIDAGADAAVAADAGPLVSPPVNAAVSDDFDGDGDVDLVTCAEGEACHFLSNDGQGNFEDTATQAASRFSIGSTSAHSLVLADFDGDGDHDLFVAPAAGPGVIETNDGHAEFSETKITWTQLNDGGVVEETDGGAPIDDPITAAAAGDLDGDGKPDLVIGNAVADDVPFRILINGSSAGAIRFTQAAANAVPARDWTVAAIAIADADHDGDADILVATPGAADGIELRLLLGDKGVFAEAHGGLPNVPGADVTALATADVNGDGIVDIIAAGKGQDRLLVNDGSGHFFDSSGTSMPIDDTTATAITLVDLDRDRDLDLIIGNAGAVTRLYLNDGTGVFRDHTPLLPLVADDAAWVSAADVDGDSDQDIMILSAAPTTPRLYLSVESLP